jgi:hypothetical protein
VNNQSGRPSGPEILRPVLALAIAGISRGVIWCHVDEEGRAKRTKVPPAACFDDDGGTVGGTASEIPNRMVIRLARAKDKPVLSQDHECRQMIARRRRLCLDKQLICLNQ